MGYYTKFSLTMEPNRDAKQFMMDNRELIERAIEDKCDRYYDFDYVYAACFESEAWNGGYGMKWYSHRGNMLAISKLFPEEIFILEGKGEDHYPPHTYDHWRETYRGGEVIEEWSAHDEREEPTWWER